MERRHSISIDAETTDLLQQVMAQVQETMGVKLSRHTAIKYLAKKELKQTNIPREV